MGTRELSVINIVITNPAVTDVFRIGISLCSVKDRILEVESPEQSEDFRFKSCKMKGNAGEF